MREGSVPSVDTRELEAPSLAPSPGTSPLSRQEKEKKRPGQVAVRERRTRGGPVATAGMCQLTQAAGAGPWGKPSCREDTHQGGGQSHPEASRSQAVYAHSCKVPSSPSRWPAVPGAPQDCQPARPPSCLPSFLLPSFLSPAPPPSLLPFFLLSTSHLSTH